MAIIEMIMPKMGESIMEATILSWLKKQGEEVEQDESVLEVATDKVDTEVPSTHAGILKEILAQEGDVVEVGKPIALIETEEDEPLKDSSPEQATQPQEPEPPLEAVKESPAITVKSNGSEILTETTTERFYSPLVKNIANKENIPVTELALLLSSFCVIRFTLAWYEAIFEEITSSHIPMATYICDGICNA